MNNTDKLLRALIDALGFEVEQIGVGRAQCDCMYSYSLSRAIRPNCPKCKGFGIIAEDIDYKVTKKDVNVSSLVELVAEAQGYLPNHAVDQHDNLQSVKLFLEGLT